MWPVVLLQLPAQAQSSSTCVAGLQHYWWEVCLAAAQGMTTLWLQVLSWTRCAVCQWHVACMVTQLLVLAAQVALELDRKQHGSSSSSSV